MHDPSVVQEHLGNGIVLVDVRESEEWDAGHIPGAKHVPRGYLESRIEGAVKDEARLTIELEGKAEPVTIGLPFSLISEAKLVADKESFRADLSGKKPS